MKQEATKTVPICLLAVVIVLLTATVTGSADESIQASIVPAQSVSPIPVLDPEDAAAGQAVLWTKFLGDPESLKSVPLYTYRLDDVCGPLPRPEANWFKRQWAKTVQKVGMVALVAKTNDLSAEWANWHSTLDKINTEVSAAKLQETTQLQTGTPVTIEDLVEVWKADPTLQPKYIGVNFGTSYKAGEKDNPYTRDTLCDAVTDWASLYQGKIVGHVAQGVLKDLPDYYIAVEYPFVDHDARDPFWAAKTPAKVRTVR